MFYFIECEFFVLLLPRGRLKAEILYGIGFVLCDLCVVVVAKMLVFDLISAH